MAIDSPCVSYMALYVISMHIVSSNSRSSSNHWKLNLSAGKVEQASAEPEQGDDSAKHSQGRKSATETTASQSNDSDASLKTTQDETPEADRMMNILTARLVSNGEWIVVSPFSDELIDDTEEKSDTNCDILWSNDGNNMNTVVSSKKCNSKKSNQIPLQGSSTTEKDSSTKLKKLKTLSCGKKVNVTLYDHLRGVSERHLHSNIPEPDVAMVFKKKGRSSEVDMQELEEKLRKAKKDVEKPGSSHNQQASQVYNLIGNFWRIKGNTQSAIECFRKALHISPEDPDILLNLARVLFNLQYLDDAIFLARRSLHLQPSGENSWLQHYTLGEILKSYGHPQEAAMHFNQALELNPDFQPAKSHLRDLDSEPCPSVTHLTLFIILFLVVGVLFGVVTSIETNLQDSGLQDGFKLQQRHFNRAMAMRSIKLGINPRLCRLRRVANS